MSSDLAPSQTISLDLQEKVLLGGDLGRLSTGERLAYYRNVCESLGLNPLTRPFEYLILNNKMQLYARKDCTEQLRSLRSISIDPKNFTKEVIEGVYVVTAWASMPDGRTDVSTGAVPIEGLKGVDKANAIMKAETKAKRRVTLSICGLGFLDESELDTVPQAKVVQNARDVKSKLAEIYIEGLGEGAGPASPPVVDQQARDAQATRSVTPDELNDTVQAIQAAISQQEVTALLSEAAGARQAGKMTAIDFGAIQKVAQQRLKQLGKK